MKKRLVVKIGSSTLTAGTDKISRGKIEDLARQILVLQEDYQIIIVSSGAIATARQFVSPGQFDSNLGAKQALAAIGQPLLIQTYNEVFRDFNLKIAQCLLTYPDIKNETSRQNTLNTLTELLKHNYIPIINENDTVSVEEIMFGDNDKLSAFVAEIVQAELLILASDIDGLYTDNPHINKQAELIREVTNLDDARKYIQEKDSKLGTGGMTTKINAAEICKKAGVEMWILNGGNQNFILDALNQKSLFTKFKTS
jgi:glutamate 5-kinase